MKIKYPIEAFALAMVIFSRTMQEALLSGIIVLLTTLIGLFIDQFFRTQIPEWSRKLCNSILVMSINYSLFQLIMRGIFQYNFDNGALFILLIIGGLIVKFIVFNDEADMKQFLKLGCSAYIALVLIGVLREFASLGSVLGFSIVNLGFMARAFQNIIFGFLLASIAIATINRIYNISNDKINSLYVILPVILINQPFIIQNINESLNILITVAVTVVFFLSVKMYITFSWVSSEFKRLPIELVSIALIYMILRIF